jgi:hypothetical protein
MERAHQLDSLVAQKASLPQQAEGFVSEQLLGDSGIDVGYGKPSSLGVPGSSGSKAMDMWVWVDETSKGLRHGDHSGPNLLVIDGLAHQLVDGLIGQTSKIGEKLPVVHEVNPEHLWESESEKRMSDVFENLVFEKGSEGGSAFCIT